MQNIINHNIDFIKDNSKKVKDKVIDTSQKVSGNVKTNVSTVRRRWYLWLFPLVAIGIAGYLFKQYFYDHGPMIKIVFDEASVIQAEKTHLRFRGVDIGTVKEVKISEDRKDVEVSVLLVKGADEFAVVGSKFWVVTPKVSLQGLSGLDTIFSGPYIEVAPGPREGEAQTVFKARSDAESRDASEYTSNYILEVKDAESISMGSSVTYRGVPVGTVGRMNLSKSGQSVEVQLNIQNRYVRLIRSNTVFWRKVGIQADLGLFGSKVQVNSLDSIMHGGVEFATPDNAGAMAKANARFALAAEAPKNSDKWNPALQ